MSAADPRHRAGEADATEEARIELERVVRRWRTLPLDHALSASAAVRDVLERLARDLDGAPASVPDLGPAVLAEQLRVIVYDALADPEVDASAVAALLTGLRREVG